MCLSVSSAPIISSSISGSLSHCFLVKGSWSSILSLTKEAWLLVESFRTVVLHSSKILALFSTEHELKLGIFGENSGLQFSLLH